VSKKLERRIAVFGENPNPLSASFSPITPGQDVRRYLIAKKYVEFCINLSSGICSTLEKVTLIEVA
jgi:hypothetical protein